MPREFCFSPSVLEIKLTSSYILNVLSTTELHLKPRNGIFLFLKIFLRNENQYLGKLCFSLLYIRSSSKHPDIQVRLALVFKTCSVPGEMFMKSTDTKLDAHYSGRTKALWFWILCITFSRDLVGLG